MLRKAGIWQRRQDGWWYCTHHGEKVKLSQDRKGTERAFHALHAYAPGAGKGGYRPTFRKLADLYLDYTPRPRASGPTSTSGTSCSSSATTSRRGRPPS